MTFSLIARCPESGMLGVVTATSGIAVGARVPWVRAGVGAIATQHRTDPRLGPMGLQLLAEGRSPEAVLAALTAATPGPEWRQIGVLDAAGRAAVFHGARVKPVFGAAEGPGVLALGNILSDARVPAAMVEAFLALPEAPFPERLLAALAAGEEAGGEIAPLRSAALLIARAEPIPYADLRVDLSAAPIAELRRLWQAYAPEAELILRRALDPAGCGP
ncbi:MAG: DUF1028 domain-containing protein [Rhodovarius sp.]|nr:DUF1028 domain-containing protein [Rhodovarius sp.]